ncbi:hypothetical protein EIN_230910 [Entamoeba invadens IP1]|uniref:Ras-GAP domain-containing protein n=1 Tax=Entamoeba invadens IP1 TaxID=370355 RepID=A0A0A1U916_ENTIV|nr:hypothetical protein EIN_230910 [Entamoeba invadens IP1]ELP88478.1 hypothetical protein EIN_230910 [Entamoeba invadens IP1]|eukprot:XP_004255249.1 hypothetical protein EIN_230910 [Entamoeba invadens IP1]
MTEELFTFTEKIEFDELLFHSSNTLLTALTETLVNRNTSKSKQNANLLLRYFFSHSRGVDLLMWAFERELTENPPESKYFPFQSGTSTFINFFSEYFKIYLKDYFQAVMTPFLNEVLSDTSHIEVAAFQNNSLENEDEIKVEFYEKSLIALKDVIDHLNTNLMGYADRIPLHFFVLMERMKERMNNNSATNKLLIKVLLYQFIICPILDDPTLIGYKQPQWSLLSRIHKLTFIRDTVFDLYKHDGHMEFSYVVALSKQLGQSFDDVFDRLATPVEFEEVQEPPASQSALHKQMSKMIKMNIQIVIDYLPTRISEKLLDIIKADPYIFDDYCLYRAVLGSISLYCLYYTRQMEKCISDSSQKRNELNALQNELAQMKTKLLEKKKNNEKLLKEVDILTGGKVPSSLKMNTPPNLTCSAFEFQHKERTTPLPLYNNTVLQPERIKKRTRKGSLVDFIIRKKDK